METEKTKSFLTKIDIVILAILATLVLVVGFFSLSRFLSGEIGFSLLPLWFFTPWGLLSILVFDVAWFVVALKFWPKENRRLKTYLNVLIIAFSVAALLSLYLVIALSNAMH
ncbi:MAG: hypothetical protein A2Y07_11565 [Planctomycetes bacterium GWF2_50_10]|nr:MAG: hypothetical protein A2Y07_11565 [Planctomycetes bacterium GWF2_50_10]